MNIFDILIVQPIFNLLITLYAVIPGGDFGVSLIVFTILVRLALWPLVKKQLHQTRKMQKLQPQLAAIKKNSGGDRKIESAKMLELYKKNGVSPFRSFGILLIQLPIFIALFQVVNMFTNAHGRDHIQQYTYNFLENLPSIQNLISDPSQFNDRLFGVINLASSAVGSSIPNNLALFALAGLAAYSQRIMTKQTMPKQQSKKKLKDILSEAANGKDTSQSEINNIVMGKMMTFMPIVMFFIMISVPGALVLYYAVSNGVAVLQQKIILSRDAEELEEIAEEAVVVETKKKTPSKELEKPSKNVKVTRIVAKDKGRGRK